MKKLAVIFVISLFLGCKPNVEVNVIKVKSISAVDMKFHSTKYLYLVETKAGTLFYTNHKYSVGDTINKF
jgi:hypothetical protein